MELEKQLLQIMDLRHAVSAITLTALVEQLGDDCSVDTNGHAIWITRDNGEIVVLRITQDEPQQ